MTGQVSSHKTNSGVARRRPDTYSDLLTGMETNTGTTDLILQCALFIIHRLLLVSISISLPNLDVLAKQVACQ